MRVLLVEDDDRVAQALVPALVKRGLAVRRLAAGRGVLDLVGEVDVILLDLGLPDIDGMTLCRRIRAASDVSVIVVSARGEVDDRIQALQAGADDYLVKPYDVGELVARVHAVRRRSADRGQQTAEPIRFDDVLVDIGRHEVRVAGEPIGLSRKEFQVLALVMSARGAVCPREQILAEVWGRSGAAENRSLDVHVATLRTKLGRPALIETVRGVGYRLAGAIVLSLVGLLVIGLGVPLALNVAASEQQSLFLDRLTDTGRYASLAQRPVLDQQGSSLSDQLASYRDVHSGQVVVFNRDGMDIANSNPGGAPPFTATDPRIARPLENALAGRHPEPASLLLPWDSDSLVIAEPVLSDGEVRGAVVTVSPTSKARNRVAFWWVVILVGGILALSLALLVALPVISWTLRPVRRLDQATGSLVSAVVSGHPVPPVDDGHGPAELRHLSRSFDQMAASVSDTLAAQRAFVADASHQLRNPLTALRLRLSNLEGHVDEEESEHHAAAMVETDRLNQIVDDLLSMARAEGMGDSLVPIDVVATVRSRMTDWEAVADSREVDLVLDAPADSVVAMALPRSVEAMLDALLDNALKFTAEGSSVDVTVTPGVRIAVRDHGPGLQSEELERATDRFWRSSAHQNVTGSGLGLSIVRRLAEQAGGSVELDLPDGGGLRVTIQLPSA